MSEGLFAVQSLAEPDSRPGYRLKRLEVLNWGTFDKRVWTFEIDGRNALLTGDIGSGKSTLVDAVTTLLMPSNKISYNKAAGAETRERDLRSYVRGYFKTARDEVHGSTKPVALRDNDTYSVILGVFANEDAGAEVTLAQVFSARVGHAGQPERFFVMSDSELSIGKDFTEFGSQVVSLKRRLRDRGASVYDHFGEYGRSFRRALGIVSDQAMELFHQTVSMKAVGDLNDFVRHHMLEPFDAEAQINQVVGHFDDLSRAHDAVLKAKTQLAELDPLLADGEVFDTMQVRGHDLAERRGVVPQYFAGHRAALLESRLAGLDAEITANMARVAAADEQLQQLKRRRDELSLQRAQLGGDRLGSIEREMERHEAAADTAKEKARAFGSLLTEAGLTPVDDAQTFDRRLVEIGSLDGQIAAELDAAAKRTGALHADLNEIDKQVAALRLDLQSLESRTTSIPRRNLELRQHMCAAFELDADELPFVGELVAVRDASADWEGAAERLLHGFALSILVPQRHYAAVSEWINNRHLGQRVVYYRVPEHSAGASRPAPAAQTMFAKLRVKDGEYANWVEDELGMRADLVCVDTMQQFRKERRAITREGQIKGGKGRHEKDDRHAIDDRRHYVLGWANERKIDAMIELAGQLQERRLSLSESAEKGRAAEESMQKRRRALTGLRQTTRYAEIDWQNHVDALQSLGREKDAIESASGDLTRIAEHLDATESDIAKSESERRHADGDLAVARNTSEQSAQRLEAVRHSLNAVDVDAVLTGTHAEALAPYRPLDLDECDQREREALAAIADEIETANKDKFRAQRGVESKMSAFRQRFPADAQEFDDSVESLSEYRQMHARILSDDLPRFEAEFKDYLNTNTIRDIGSFHTALAQQEELIRERIARINQSLVEIDFNKGRFIRLEHQATPNTEIRQFRQDLRACTAGTVSRESSQHYSEQKFLEVKKLVERFKGRDGYGELDRRWTRSVTDVRNWLVFSASERWRDTDDEHEHYTDSGGKSGGQKEKLAYTILAASLAYQFRLEWGVKQSHNFQFVVIDEAFGRGSDESTRFALGLFAQLGLQLLIVTPLQKIQIIEPYVSTVGLVDNVDGDNSRIQVLTVEDYAKRRRLYASGTPAGESSR